MKILVIDVGGTHVKLLATGRKRVRRIPFLGLGTGLGSAMVIGKTLVPLELAHLPYRKGRTFEDYAGLRGLNRLGKKKWRRAVADIASRLKAAMVTDYVVLGGGNAKRIERLPPDTRRGDNRNAFLGGYRLWDPTIAVASPSHPSHSGRARPPQARTHAKS